MLPFESFSASASGYFNYRSKPFTAIRAYAPTPSDWKDECLHLDLWDGPYKRLDPQTFCLRKKEPGRFLFLRWKASYGRPTFLHHNLSEKLVFGKQTYIATFWIQTIDSPATIHFYSNGVFSDPVTVDGPLGLVGIVLWPGLTHDLWGTALVKNEAYAQALAWTDQQVEATSVCLANNLEAVLERVQSSDLIGRSHLAETIHRMRSLWGRRV